MTTLSPTNDELERLERLRSELSDAHAGPYASVETEHVLAYLLDLADAVDDPDRRADPAVVGPSGAERDDGSDERSGRGDRAFPRDRLRSRLERRNRKHADPDDESRMDLYTIAAEYDVAGRSEMTKDELVEAILDAAERLYENPFALADVEFTAEGGDVGEESGGGGEESGDGDEDDDRGAAEANDDGGAENPESAGDSEDARGTDDGDGGGSGQLDAMLSLLDTHADKWRDADGDARYEVDLPDGTTETARTKDDVRALLFKNY